MLRLTGFSTSFSHFRAVSVGALVLATIACSDNTAPTPSLYDGVESVEIIVPDSLKEALLAQSAASLLNSSVKISANILAPASFSVASLSATCGSGAGFAGYQKSQVAFAPEATPGHRPDTVYEDGLLKHVPIGFSFSFYGNAHNEVTIYSNGFVMFGPPVDSGFVIGDLIPYAANPNNIIALGWSDWSPQKVAAGGIRYETRGQAPNRRFIVQFTDVPESGGNGKLTSQLVLNEGSNDITIHTSTVSTTKFGRRVTQGIENAAGTDAVFDSVQNVVTGVLAPRVKNKFQLTNDAVRFSLISSKDDQAPSITPAADVSVGNDPGLASAVVAVAAPARADNCSDVTVSSTRSDNAPSDAPYPVGVTTITWTATDAAGNFASAAQKITVLDIEAPVFGSSARSAVSSASAVTVNATSPSGAVFSYDAAATDNVGVTSLLCEPASGSVFPVGDTTVTCSASDAAGNSSSKSFSVSVIGAREQLANLMVYVKALGLPNGTANPLINQLKSAYSEQGNECKKMSDFIEMASKKSSDIDLDDAAYMAAEANRIRGAFGCAVGALGRAR